MAHYENIKLTPEEIKAQTEAEKRRRILKSKIAGEAAADLEKALVDVSVDELEQRGVIKPRAKLTIKGETMREKTEPKEITDLDKRFDEMFSRDKKAA